MTFNINQFKSEGLVYGGARPSLFEVSLPADFPMVNTPGGDPVETARKATFLAKAASLPPSNLDYIDVPYMSRKIRVNGDRNFPDWAITVMNDEDFMIRRSLEGWHNAINERVENVQMGAGLSPITMYKRDIIVRQYGKTGSGYGPPNNAQTSSTGSPIYVYTLIGAFPTAVDMIGLDWDEVNRIEQFDVTFTYDYWVPWEEIRGDTAGSFAFQGGING